MASSPHDQATSRVRLEWGPLGGSAVAGATYAVVVDVLSFTTTVSVAVDRGVAVLPWRWRDRGERAEAYAAEHAATLAVPRGAARADGGVSLSPVSVREAPNDLRRLVLPSPNGATTSLVLADRGATVVAASLRNRTAAARWLADRLAEPGVSVALVPAGERWAADDSLRPAVEDLWGAGALLETLTALAGRLALSPEARTALAAWRDATAGAPTVSGLADLLRSTSSGRELAGAGHDTEAEVAAEVDTSDAVPILRGTSFVPADEGGGMRAL